jgi:ribosomal protein S14
MTIKNFKKAFKQLEAKPVKLKKYEKHNSPTIRKIGIGSRRCRYCGRFGAHVRSYGLHLCRQCFRDKAKELGFKKFN